LGVDRGGFGEVSETGWAIRLTHFYATPGVPATAPDIQASHLPWYSAMVRRGEVLKLGPLPDGLPAEAVHEREYCARSGLKSLLTIPLTVDGTVRFAIGCAMFREYRSWPEDLVQRFRLLGEVFANALARKRADEELRRRERRYRDLVESTRALPWEADPGTLRMTYIAPQIETLLGYPRDVWYRDGFWAARLHPDDRDWVLRGIGEAVRGGRDREAEYRLVAADGRTVWVHNMVAVRAEEGVPTEVHGVIIDVTARKAAEAEATRLRDLLTRATRMTTLGELAAAIAHEVNQPLCAIVSNAETAQSLLAGGLPDVSEAQDALRDIVIDGRRASETVGRIRSMIRGRPPEPAPFDVAAAAREVAALLRHQLTRDSVTLTLDLSADLPPVLGDRVQVQEVILNLLLNAADALATGPADRRRVVLSAARAGDEATVAVRDTGPGVGPDVADRVFDSFFTTKPGGTGIGLSISRKIVEALGGRLWVEPAPGGGAAFTFTLPLATGPSS
jgi:PAS domain S-box-containing protein